MKKIMFICTGNICRSPMAEGLLNKRLKEENIDAISVSSGIHAEDGAMPTYNAVQAIAEYDVDISNHKATYIKNSNIEDMDIILCATSAHKNRIIQAYPNLKEKIYTMKEFAYGKEHDDLDLNDPWGYDIEIYRNCAKQISDIVEKIIEKLK